LVARPAAPILGFSTWNCFRGNINESTLQSVADSMKQTGLVAAGYSYFNVRLALP
jgi:alpha-galactosidase